MTLKKDTGVKKGAISSDAMSLQALVYGGAILGGGGGGTCQDGLDTIEIATRMGTPRIVSLEEINASAMVATVSAVGAPAAKQRHLKPIDFVKALEKLMNNFDRPISGVISSEMGARASVNGMIQSAVLGLPVVDAPANGRAHPLGVMGSLGLHVCKEYVSMQTACGGDSEKGRRVELLVHGDLEKCSALVREASVQAGGVVAVARNPVSAEYLKKHAAIGALACAQALGKKYLSALECGKDAAQLIAEELEGEVIGCGRVSELTMRTDCGLDVGHILLDTGHELTIWNEYITVDWSGKRIYSFPDLIVSIDARSNLPVNTCQLEKGMEICVIGVSRRKLILGSTMKDQYLLSKIQNRLGVNL